MQNFRRSISILSAIGLTVFSGVQPLQAEEAVAQAEDLSLEDIFNLEVVTASKTKEKLGTAPGTILVVTEEDIIKNGYMNLKDVLRNLPSVMAVDSQFVLLGGQRGLNSNFSQTLLLINGREMQSLVFGESNINRHFSTQNIKRIEVIQGPGSALYGANALVGVINIITKNGSPDYEGSSVSVEAGNYNTKAYSLNFGKKLGDLRVGGALRLETSDTYDFSRYYTTPLFPGADPKTVTMLDGDTYEYSNRSRFLPLSFRVDYKGFYAGRESYQFETRYGLLHGSLDKQSEMRRQFQSMDYVGYQGEIFSNTELTVEYQHSLEKFTGYEFWFDSCLYNGDGDWCGSPLGIGYIPDYPTADGGSHANGDRPPQQFVYDWMQWYYSNEWGPGSMRDRAYVQLMHKFREEGSVIWGLVGDQVDLRADPGSSYEYIPPLLDDEPANDNYNRRLFFKQQKYSAYLQFKDRYSVFGRPLYVTLGGRYDHQSIYGGVSTLRSGLVYGLFDKTNLKFMFGQAFREPTIYEYGSLGADAPDLSTKPSHVNTFELGLNHSFSSKIQFSTVAFVNEVTDYIRFAGGDNNTFVNDKEPFYTSGLESSLFLKPITGMTADFGHAWVDSRSSEFKGASAHNLNIYEHRINGGVSYDFWDKMMVGIRGNFFSAVNASARSSGEIIRLGGGTIWDMTVGVRAFKLAGVSWNLTGSVRNLFDRDLAMPTITGESDFIPMAGREYVARLTAEF
jgi:outer membrane cobalamin receptor